MCWSLVLPLDQGESSLNAALRGISTVCSACAVGHSATHLKLESSELFVQTEKRIQAIEGPWLAAEKLRERGNCHSKPPEQSTCTSYKSIDQGSETSVKLLAAWITSVIRVVSDLACAAKLQCTAPAMLLH